MTYQKPAQSWVGAVLPTGLHPCTAGKATSIPNALSQETETVSHRGQW